MNEKKMFSKYLEECYYDEVFGVSLFLNLEKNSSDEHQKHIWKSLKKLEEITRDKIKLVLNDIGIYTIHSQEKNNVAKGVLLAKDLENKEWSNIMSELSLEVIPYLNKYREARKFYSLDTYAIVDFIIAHEEAILYLANSEKNKTSKDSLLKVNQIIHFL